MKSCFERESVNIVRYTKYYNPKNKYLAKKIIYETKYITHFPIETHEDNDIFISRYDVSDYDTFADLY